MPSFDLGALIGLIVVATGAIVIALSYVGVYFLGRFHGSRQAVQEFAPREDGWTRARLDNVDVALETMAGSVKRLADAQRVWVNYQDRAAASEHVPQDAAEMRAIKRPMLSPRTPS